MASVTANFKPGNHAGTLTQADLRMVNMGWFCHPGWQDKLASGQCGNPTSDLTQATSRWGMRLSSNSSNNTALIQIGLAGCSNALAASVTNPIDVVKVRMQMAGVTASGATVRYKGVADCARQILEGHGWRGFYRGVSASLMREMSYSGIRMGLYEPVKSLLTSDGPASSSLAMKVTAGAMTGATGSIIANPCDLLKVRMQSVGIPGGRAPYRSTAHAFVEVLREGGASGLWRGSAPTVARATLLTASQVPSYDHVKHYMLENGYMREGYLCHFFCSMTAGVVAAGVTSPVDLVKSRVMVQPVDPLSGRGTLYGGMVDCVCKVVRSEGPAALFKGFHSQWLRIGPHTTISLMAFEQLRHMAGMNYL